MANQYLPMGIEKSNSNPLEYLCTLQDKNNTTHHFFRSHTYDDWLMIFAEQKSKELNGDYLITKNDSETSIHVIITCNNEDWKTKIKDPVLTNTIRRSQNA